MQKLIVDNRFSKIAEEYFKGRYEVIPSPVIEELPPEVNAHPDMGLVRIKDVFVAEPTVFEFYKELLSGSTVLCGKTWLSRHYPNDIAYNVLISETVAFGNETYIDPVVKDVLKEKGILISSVKQGYAKCSAANIKNVVITADKTIEKSAKEKGFKTLLIASGDVALKGYDYGFLGGATGEIDGGLFFFGDITKHRDFGKIDLILKENEIFYEFLRDVPLTDVGTVILV